MRITYTNDIPKVDIEEDTLIEVDLAENIFLSKVTEVYDEDDDEPVRLYRRTLSIQGEDATIAIELTSADRDTLEIKPGKPRKLTKLSKTKVEPPPAWLFPKRAANQKEPEE